MAPKTSSDPLYDRIAQSFRSQAFLTLLGPSCGLWRRERW